MLHSSSFGASRNCQFLLWVIIWKAWTGQNTVDSPQCHDTVDSHMACLKCSRHIAIWWKYVCLTFRLPWRACTYWCRGVLIDPLMVNKSAQHVYPRKQLRTASGMCKSHFVTRHNSQWISTVKFSSNMLLKDCQHVWSLAIRKWSSSMVYRMS